MFELVSKSNLILLSLFSRHIDSHHKLIRWRIIIHGCIDGFSRVIVYLHCCDNNRADTVAALFCSSVERLYWPRRVRSDMGMENIEVARMMLDKYGPQSCPHLTGLSVHNQRIERLWRDVITYVVSHFRDLLYSMEDNNILDPLNEVHLLAVQKVFVPRIDKALNDFILQWNFHPLRTEQSRTPMQLWMGGIYQNVMGDSVRDMVNRDEFDPAQYGVDVVRDDELAEIETNNNVNIPRHPFDLSDHEEALMSQIDPLTDDGEYGVAIYLHIVDILQGLDSVRAHYRA